MIAETTAPLSLPPPPLPLPLPRRSTAKIAVTVAVIVPLAMVMFEPLIFLIVLMFKTIFDTAFIPYLAACVVLPYWLIRSLVLSLWRDSRGPLVLAGLTVGLVFMTIFLTSQFVGPDSRASDLGRNWDLFKKWGGIYLSISGWLLTSWLLGRVVFLKLRPARAQVTAINP